MQNERVCIERERTHMRCFLARRSRFQRERERDAVFEAPSVASSSLPTFSIEISVVSLWSYRWFIPARLWFPLIRAFLLNICTLCAFNQIPISGGFVHCFSGNLFLIAGWGAFCNLLVRFLVCFAEFRDKDWIFFFYRFWFLIGFLSVRVARVY